MVTTRSIPSGPTGRCWRAAPLERRHTSTRSGSGGDAKAMGNAKCGVNHLAPFPNSTFHIRAGGYMYREVLAALSLGLVAACGGPLEPPDQRSEAAGIITAVQGESDF